MGEKRNAYKTFMRKPEGKRLRGRPRGRWEDISMYLRVWGGKVWTGFIWLGIGTSNGLL
jgi:hypothetical protein